MRTPHLRSFRASLLAAVAICLCAAVPSQAQSTLRWKFRKGDSFKYTMTDKNTTTQSFMNQKVELKISKVLETTWTVNDVASGKADITQTVDRVQFDIDQPGITLHFDSKDGKMPEGPLGQVLGPMLQALAGSNVQFKMTEDGEVSDVKLSEKLLEATKNAGPAAGKMFDEESMKRLISETMLSFPKEALSKGKSWNKTVTVPLPTGGSMKVETTYTYQGPDSKNPSLQRIDVVLKTDFETPANGPQVTVKSQEGKGFFLFDNSQGRVNESEVVQKQDLSVKTNGAEINSSVDSKSSIKLAGAS